MITGSIHVALVPAHLREAPYAGALFIALAGAAVALALLLLVSDAPLVWLGATVLSIAALLAYAASRSVGLPALGDDIGDWLNPLGITAAISESGTVVVSAWALLRSRARGDVAHASPANRRWGVRSRLDR